jgi:hypothetical protein
MKAKAASGFEPLAKAPELLVIEMTNERLELKRSELVARS